MRVMTFHNDYLQHGGETQSVLTINKALRDLEIENQLWLLQNKIVLDKSFSAAIQFLSSRNGVESVILHDIEKFGPDIVQVENIFPFLGPPLMRVLRRLEVPWVRTYRNYRMNCIAGTQFRKESQCSLCSSQSLSIPAVVFGCYKGSRTKTTAALAVRELSEIEARAFPPAARVVTSQYLGQQLFGSSRDDVHVIPNPVDLNPGPQVRSWCEREWDFTFLGRLEPEKGIGVFLELVDLFPNKNFVICGAGPMEGVCSEKALEQSNLSLVGEKSPSEVGEILSNSRFTLVPSLWEEPFGRIVLEAATLGSIPVARASGGLKEVVRTLGAEEFLVSGKDARDWASHLSRLLAMEAAYLEHRSQEISHQAGRKFSPKKIASQWKALYASVL